MSTEFIENLSLPSMFSPIRMSNTLPTVLISTPESEISMPSISITPEREWVQFYPDPIYTHPLFGVL